MIITFLMSAIAIGTVLLFGCVGETITEKAGHLNLGIPGIMCTGTVGGCLFINLYLNSLENVVIYDLENKSLTEDKRRWTLRRRSLSEK